MDEDEKQTRAGLAGIHLARSIIEMVNLMYQNKTALNFLRGLHMILEENIIIRQKELKK